MIRNETWNQGTEKGARVQDNKKAHVIKAATEERGTVEGQSRGYISGSVSQRIELETHAGLILRRHGSMYGEIVRVNLVGCR